MAKSWIAIEEHADEVQDVELMEVPSESLESDLVEVTGLDKDVESLVADGEELEHDQEQVEALGDLPTKDELYAKIAGSINALATKLAVGINEIPSGLARGLKAYSEKEE